MKSETGIFFLEEKEICYVAGRKCWGSQGYQMKNPEKKAPIQNSIIWLPE